MASKKYKLLLMGFLTLISCGVFAQDTGVYSIFDSSVVPKKGMAQQNEFMNNTYDFPAKPRSQTEFGISGGMFSISGDVSAKLPTVGFSAHLQKALGYIFSLRLQYEYGVAKGLNWKPSNGYQNDPAWAMYGTAPVYYNYRAHVQDLSLSGIFTLNNIRFHKQKTGMVLYGGAGFGATIYDTRVQNLTSSGGLINFGSITQSGYKNRKEIRSSLKSLLSGAPYHEAQNHKSEYPTLFGQTLRPSGSVIAGIAFKLGKRVNLALEDKFTFVKDDLLDGQQYQDGSAGNLGVLSGDYDTYNYASVGLNFNIGKKAIEPLWWINPLDYAYSEINNPKHMKLPKPVFDDADGDGVVDQLDKEPNTPAGCPVDSHGVSRDTDGDGVPDCKDKQLITPTECQPVDADGVGKCPDPACCHALDSLKTASACQIGDLPSISFKGKAGGVSSDAKAMLATVASKLKNSAACSIMITGYPAASKASQALCNKRVAAIKTYLTEKEGISADRIDTNCEVGGGDANTVDIKSK